MKKLPALKLEVSSQVISSNLNEFEKEAEIFIDSINEDLQTDEDFVQAKETIKHCKSVESQLDVIIDDIVSKSEGVGQIIEKVKAIKTSISTKRLNLNNTVTNKEKVIKDKCLKNAAQEVDDFRTVLNKIIEPFTITYQFDSNIFASAIKGKRTTKSIDKALNDVVFTIKEAMQAECDAVKKNYNWFLSESEGYRNLFPDLATIVKDPHPAFVMLVNARIGNQLDKERLQMKNETASSNAIQPDEQINTEPAVDSQISGTPYGSQEPIQSDLAESQPTNYAQQPVSELEQTTKFVECSNQNDDNAYLINIIRRWYSVTKAAGILEKEILSKLNPHNVVGTTTFALKPDGSIYLKCDTELKRDINTDTFNNVWQALLNNGIDPNTVFYYMPHVSNSYETLLPLDAKAWIDKECMKISIESKLTVVDNN